MNRSLFDLARKLKLEKTSREFRDFREAHGYSAARRLMDETFADFPDADHNFVREFQTACFSARFLEPTLLAALREQGKVLDRTSPAPDFVVSGDAPVAIEATTTNPPQGEAAEDVDIAAAVRCATRRTCAPSALHARRGQQPGHRRRPPRGPAGTPFPGATRIKPLTSPSRDETSDPNDL
ncbi:hypothetical protein ABZ958_36420 [Streptomyces sp. NPDC046237]|uniref:hypothetical protein n=1 Tax=Streptomyces sp. NPDC046237 TaxID=3154914 RepID=UPI0034038AC2